MAQEEIFGTRNQSYSQWHRAQSISRYIEPWKARLLGLIDLDHIIYVEYDDSFAPRTQKCRRPLALIEAAIDKGQNFKSAEVTAQLAEMAGIPAFVVLYSLSENSNPAAPDCLDISRLRVKRLRPRPEQKQWRILSPKEWAENLWRMRTYQLSLIQDSKLSKIGA